MKSSDWFAGAVAFVSSRELFQGVSDAQFAPTVPMTRAMLVTVLHRLEDQPGAGAAASFGDVPAGAWYALAVAWASENSIVTGTGSGFNPDGNVTREQMAAILYRYNAVPGAGRVRQRRSEQIQRRRRDLRLGGRRLRKWAVGAGILTGKSGTILDPTGTASRAEVATMLQRLVNLMIEAPTSPDAQLPRGIGPRCECAAGSPAFSGAKTSRLSSRYAPACMSSPENPSKTVLR